MRLDGAGFEGESSLRSPSSSTGASPPAAFSAAAWFAIITAFCS